MLQSLNIKNTALIKSLTIDFSSGFNVLLGETGAGKSIIFDALGFVLGGKPDKELIRHGEEFMKVDAQFVNLSSSCQNLIEELGVECEENEIILSRQLYIDGKSVIRANGSPVTSSVLKKIGSILVDSYSQHESLDLMKDKNHLALLDKFGGQSLRELKSEVEERYARVVDTKNKVKELGGDEFERERTKSLLDYQIKEIEEADLHIGEDQEIKERLTLLNQSEKLCDAVKDCNALLADGSTSAIGQVQSSLMALNNINGIEELDQIKERLNSTKYELQDINDSLCIMQENLNFNEFELEKLDKRHDLIKSMLKKYGGTIEEVLDFLAAAKEKYNKLADAEFELSRLENLLAGQLNALKEVCDSLTNKRKETAKVIEKKVVEELANLGMKNTKFVVQFSKLDTFSANGNDEVAFNFSANVGQEVKALSKTASGGEMSRFMLAFKNIFAEFGSASTLIFDEIDSGIGGETGVVVGQKIDKLAQNFQVICITHLPQVASFGDAYYYVSKSAQDGETFTHIEKLEGEKITYQLARLIGGDNVTDTALKHAQEMLKK